MIQINLKIIFLVLVSLSFSFAQNPVPRWFIEQGKLPCSAIVVQFSRPYYKDSIKPYLKFYSAKKIASEKKTFVSGSYINWKTEAGNYAVSGYLKIGFDTSAFNQYYQKDLKILDYFVTPNNSFFALVSYEDCDIPKSFFEKVKFDKKAAPWLENLPDEKGYIYCVGSCDKYYYDYRTWEEAEKHAVKQLAITKYSQNAALMKTENNVGDEQQRQEFIATLLDYKVIARWADFKNGIYYILVKVKS